MDKTIEITSDKEIMMYGVKGEVHSDDGYLALSTDALGTEYYTISYGDSAHTFAVLATEDSTQVSVKLTNNTQVFVLNKDFRIIGKFNRYLGTTPLTSGSMSP